MNKIKVVGYCRKSPDEKEDTKTSIDNQKKIISDTCEKNNWELVGMYIDEQISGSDRNRKEFLKMIAYVYGSDVQVIVVKASDRFARDTAFFIDTLDTMKALDKKLFSCIENKFVNSDDLGDNLRSFIDGQYVKDQRRKADLLLQQKMKEGKPIGNPIFGYKYNYKFNSAGNKVLIEPSLQMNDWIIDEKDSKIVLSVLSDYLNNVNFATTMKDLGIPKAKYYRIINNASSGCYSGYICYERKHRDPDKKILRVENVFYKGTHKPIISEEMYKKIQEKLKSKNGV